VTQGAFVVILETDTSESDRLQRAFEAGSVAPYRGQWVVVQQAEPRDDSTTMFTLLRAELAVRPEEKE
jgi:hypothetical protein